VSLEHTLLERPDVASFLAESEPPPMSEELREATAELARELAGAWSHGALPAGVQLGAYTIREPLGHGGQASVYRAEDAEGQSYAVKVPRQELLERLIREAQILFHLDHPRVVRIITADVKGSPPYLVTEHLSGGTLAEVLDAVPEGQLPPERVRELGLAVLEALSYAHEKGVIHRDLKPSNILFDAGGEAKVADFGIGSLSLVERLEGTLVSHDKTGVAGTPLYMAPEQELPGGTVDARADLYALGKVVYRALTGRSPRTIRPLRKVLPDLDLAWEDFILRLVEDDPAERYASAEAAREALAKLPGSDEAPSTSQEERVTPVAPQQVVPQQVAPPSDSDRAPWATGYVVDQMLAVARRLSNDAQGGLFAFVPHPWEPGPLLRGIRSTERSLADLEGILATEPLGVVLRGRTIRATFDPRGTDSRQAWLDAALSGYLSEVVLDPDSVPDSLLLIGPDNSVVAEAGASHSGDWLHAAEGARRGRPFEGWLSVAAGEDHFLVAYAPGGTPPSRQLALERLGWLAQRVAAVLAPGEVWRHTSPGQGFDTTQRNRIAQDLAQRGALVLHVEPSGRFLVYSGQGVQSTRSAAYLRRLLEGGLGLHSAPGTWPIAPSKQAASTRPAWLVPGVLLAGLAYLALCAPGLKLALDWWVGIFGVFGAGYVAWELSGESNVGRKVIAFVVMLMVIGIAVGLLPAALG
jgi:serine/threonine protein kinase